MMQAANKAKAAAAPPEVTDGPPANIEGFDSTIPGEPAGYGISDPPKLAPAQKTAVVVFDEPTDDSRASQVMRKAATYARTAAEYAQHLASVEKIKAELLQAQFKLDDAVAAKDVAESELKELVKEIK